MSSPVKSQKKANQKKHTAGGAAPASGMNFQAAVTSIAAINILCGRALGWLDGLVNDLPVALSVETGGPGDDLRLEYKDETIAEIQIKRGLRADNRLWSSLLLLAEAIHLDAINYGILAVSHDSSKTITHTLSRDLKRIGDGRTDHLGALAETFRSKLSARNLDAETVFRRLRIVVIHASDSDKLSVDLVQTVLGPLLADRTQITHAWNSIYKDAGELIERRGRRVASAVVQLLASSNIPLATTGTATPGTILTRLNTWVLAVNSSFTISGVRHPLPIQKAWIPIRAVVREEVDYGEGTLEDALTRYHGWTSGNLPRDAKVVDAEWIGRFIPHSVIVAGPGIGKSTLITKLAKCYASDGYPVLKVSLPLLAKRLREGIGFTEALLELSLDGSPITPAEFKTANIQDWVILCDGLDECGANQELLTTALRSFVTGRPTWRVIVTTRPIGYKSSLLGQWRHYELLPPQESAVSAHISNLIRCIVPESEPLFANALKVTTAALKESKASNVITRTPLLIGLAAALLARGKPLGETKVQLYDRIFDLINEVPTTRETKAPAPGTTLQYVLDLVGWDIIEHPLNRAALCSNRIAASLATQLGLLPLQAKDLAERCMTYWEEVGLIERVQHGDEDTLTFIHKTFSEFAAARFLLSLSAEEQERRLNTIFELPAWVEVLNFAASLGLATSVCTKLLSEDVGMPEAVRMTCHALQITGEADVPPEAMARKILFERAFTVIGGARREHAYKIGDALTGVGSRYPNEIGPLARPLLDHKQPWTRLVGWDCVVEAGTEYFSLEQLQDAVVIIPSLIKSEGASNLSRGLNLGDKERKILNKFMLGAVKFILENCTDEICDVTIPSVIADKNFQTLGFTSNLYDLLKKHGKSYPIEGYTRALSAFSDLIGSGEYETAQQHAFLNMFKCLLPDDVNFESNSEGIWEAKNLLQLSAFIQLTDFMDSEMSDIWAWNKPFDEVAVAEVFRGLVGVSVIEPDKLVKDVIQFGHHMEKREKGQFTSIFDVIVDVDIPAPLWPDAKQLNLDRKKLEASLHHGSNWLVALGSILMNEIVAPDELRAAIERLISANSEITLWTAAKLCTQLEQSVAVSLVLQRLTQPLNAGCRHIFFLLADLPIEQTDEVFNALRNGLFNENPSVADAAAKAALSLAIPNALKVFDHLSEAYEFWKTNEEPYPTEGGVVPPSPRDKILKGMLAVKEIDGRQLIKYASDSRWDVREIGRAALFAQMTTSDEVRQEFMGGIVSGALSSGLLGASLNQKVPFSAAQTLQITELLQNPSAQLRFDALKVLNEQYLTVDEIHRYATALKDDPALQIRDAAYRLLDAG